MEQNRDPEIGPYKHTQLMFDKDAKTIQQRKNSLLTNGAGAIGYIKKKQNKTTST